MVEVLVTGDRYRLIWLQLDLEAQQFLRAQPRRHRVHDALAKADRIAHHATLWFTGTGASGAEAVEVYTPGARLAAHPIGIASDERVEALVIEIAGQRFQYGSQRLLHITLSLAPGIEARDSVRLLAERPLLTPVGWRKLPGIVMGVLPEAPPPVE
jgi:hypothetical protein